MNSEEMDIEELMVKYKRYGKLFMTVMLLAAIVVGCVASEAAGNASGQDVQNEPDGFGDMVYVEGESHGSASNLVERKERPIHVNVESEVLETEYHKWVCKSIDIEGGEVMLTKVCTPKQDWTYIMSVMGEYIEDAETGQKYYLTWSEIGFDSMTTILRDTKPREFKERYEMLPKSVRVVNISSGSEYYVKGLVIR